MIEFIGLIIPFFNSNMAASAQKCALAHQYARWPGRICPWVLPTQIWEWENSQWHVVPYRFHSPSNIGAAQGINAEIIMSLLIRLDYWYTIFLTMNKCKSIRWKRGRVLWNQQNPTCSPRAYREMKWNEINWGVRLSEPGYDWTNGVHHRLLRSSKWHAAQSFAFDLWTPETCSSHKSMVRNWERHHSSLVWGHLVRGSLFKAEKWHKCWDMGRDCEINLF